MTTDRIIDQISCLGYVVREFRVNGTVEFHAVPRQRDDLPQIARCNDGTDEDAAYKAACLLAEAVGINLEG